jgi:hypothetical protein
VARRRLVDQEYRRDYLEMVNLGKVSARLQREYLKGATQLSLRRVFRPPRAQSLKNPPRTLLVRNVVSLNFFLFQSDHITLVALLNPAQSFCLR